MTTGSCCERNMLSKFMTARRGDEGEHVECVCKRVTQEDHFAVPVLCCINVEESVR